MLVPPRHLDNSRVPYPVTVARQAAPYDEPSTLQHARVDAEIDMHECPVTWP